jgi:hypothetical protein
MLLRNKPNNSYQPRGWRIKSRPKYGLKLRVADSIAKFVYGLAVLLKSQIFQLIFK